MRHMDKIVLAIVLTLLLVVIVWQTVVLINRKREFRRAMDDAIELTATVEKNLISPSAPTGAGPAEQVYKVWATPPHMEALSEANFYTASPPPTIRRR